MDHITSPSALNRIARLAGALYLIGMASAIFSESFVRGSLIVAGDAAQTAKNIMESEPLFRLSIAADLFTYVTVVVLTWSLYVLLRPINRDLALLAVFFRIAEIATHFVVTFHSMTALRYLSGADYLSSFDSEQLHTLARIALSDQGAGLNTGFILLGLGSTVFAYLFFQSGYVPKLLAGLGVFASLLLATYAMAVIVTPAARSFWIYTMPPMGLYEVTLGFWLLLGGAKNVFHTAHAPAP